LKNKKQETRNKKQGRIMLRHILTITYRSILHNKGSFFINLLGLSAGLVSVLFIYLWVSDEMEVDKFHENERRLYQVMQNFESPQGIITSASSPGPLAKAMEEKIPEIESSVAISTEEEMPEGIISHADISLASEGIVASGNFFEVFSYSLIQGNSKQVLANKNSIVLSEALALKLFQTTNDVVGKIVKWKNSFIDATYQVSGIFGKFPKNSSLQFDFVLNIEREFETLEYARDWKGSYAETFLLLKTGTDIDKFNDRIDSFLQDNHPTRNPRSLFVQKYSDRYLFGQYENGIQAGGRITYVKFFSLIALFILLIACINFMNLSTARASKKMREIGVKKSIGANRKSLALQFLSESILMAILSMGLALSTVSILLPLFNELTAKDLSLNFDPHAIIAFVAMVVFTGFLAGSYPAFYLSGFKTVSVLKGKLNKSKNELWIRRGLVIFQFALSLVFIVGALVIRNQLSYIQTKNLGFQRNNVLSFQRPGNSADIPVFLAEIKNISGVINASYMSHSILSEVYSQL